ncbi:MAG: hypothetical protein H0V51_09435 [Chloroflexi bacterium]|nr:hypothetical protein [Chloroflexota bacterium]
MGADDIERMVIHDLGVAFAMMGRTSDAVRLAEESLGLAEAAGDRLLLRRCSINLPSLMAGNGDDWRRILALMDQGISVARRAMDRSTLGWLLANRAEMLLPLGRLEEAIDAGEESIATADALGVPELAATRREAHAWTLYQAGRRSEAMDMSKRAGNLPPEPQAEVWQHVWAAVVRWASDPPGAVTEFASALRGDPSRPYWGVAALWLGRMALRRRDGAAAESASDIVQAATAGSSGPARLLERRWMAALLLEASAALEAVRAVAQEYEARGYLLTAADAFADAAILAARAGADAAELTDSAIGLYERCGAVPMLDALPESRWYGTDPVAADVVPNA